MKNGDVIRFKRHCFDAAEIPRHRAYYGRNRKGYILSDANEDGLLLVGFAAPLKGADGGAQPNLTAPFGGFRYCRYIPRSFLLLNAKIVDE